MTEKSDKSNLPTYISFGAFTSFINKLRESGVPGKIDRSLMGKASGSLISALLSGLKFMGLTDESGRPTAKMHALVEASDEARKPLYADLLRSSYGFLLNDPEFDVTKATTAQVAELFRGQDASGSTVSKSIGFLISLAKAGDVKLSPHLKAPPAPRGAKRVSKTPVGKADSDASGAEEEEEGEEDPETERFEIPIPGKTSVRVMVPKDLDADDWEMLQSMITVYIKRWKGFKST